MAKSKLEYWSGSAWVQAKTIDFGQGTQNALLNLDIEDKLNSPMKANITLTNAARNPFSSGTATDRYGPLTSVFTDFMPIRIIETSTNVVLFSGKIYDIKNIYDKQYGQVVKLYARDNLAEIADYPTDDKTSPINMTTSQRRSDLIQLIIRDAASDPLNASLNISSDNIYYGDAAKFTASARTFDEADSYTISGLSRQGLKAIYEIANNDPHEASGEIANFGYDYYVDSKYTTTASHTAAADFNYFKRGTRTPFQSTVANFKGAWVEYPIATNFTTTGLKQLMFPDYDFNLPKRDLYTGATAAISRNLVTIDDEGNQVTNSVNFNLEIELLEGTIAGSNSGAFQWKNKKLVRLGDNVSADSAFAEVLTSGGGPVGRVQYQSATSGTGYIVISFEPDVLTNTTISTQKKNFNALSGSAIVLTGADTGATFTFNTTSGRPSKALGLSRPLRITTSDSKHINSMRRRVASALSRAKTSRTNCTLRVLPPPFNYVDSTVASVTSSTQIVLDTNVFDYGLRVGMTIAKIDANGTQTAYGYVSAINGSTTVTATLNTGNWSGYSGSVRVYIPIRASHYIYAKNLLANFAGYMFLNGVVYTEGIGAQVTQYKGTGVNTVGTTIGLGIDPNAIQSSIESEGGKYPREINVPMGGLGWTYRPTSNTDTAAFSPVDRNTISWTGGEFVIGNMKRFKIRAGNSPDLSTSIDGDTGYPYIYKVFFDPDQSPDGSGTYTFSFIREDAYYPDMDHVMMAVARAAKLSTGRAIIIFDGTGAGMFGGLDAAGEDQFSAALFKKTVQPYTTNLVLSAGTNTGANKHRYASSTAATISFADDTTVSVEANNSIDLGTVDDTVYYIFFKMVKSDNSETDDFTLVANAEVDRTTTYSDATSGSRGLLAIASTGDVSELDEIALQAFHGKGQNITADVIAANAIVAEAIKAGSITTDKLAFTAAGTGNIVGMINSSSEGIDISGAKINISGSTTFSGVPSTATNATAASNALTAAGVADAKAVTANNDADAAQDRADAAFDDAADAQGELNDIGNDAKVAPAEKPGAKTLWDGIVAEYSGIISQASSSGQSSTAYAAAYAALNTYLNSTINVFGNMATVTNVTRTTWKSKWETYYSTKQALLNAIAEQARSAAATADQTANDKTTTFQQSSTPSALKEGDVWYNTSTQKIYIASDTGTGNWVLRDDAGAINNATTNIQGGRIQTQAIILTEGGSSRILQGSSSDTAGDGVGSGTRILLHQEGIYGYNGSTVQFYMDALDGRAYFGGGAVKLDSAGMTITSGGYVKSAGKTYGSSGAGFFLGYSNSNYQFDIGNSANYLRWSGSALSIKGTITLSDGTAEAAIKNSAVNAAHVGLDGFSGYSPSGITSSALTGNHTGNVNGLDVSDTAGARVQFSNQGISAYTDSGIKATLSAVSAAFTAYGTGGGNSAAARQANAALLIVSGGHVSYISSAEGSSDMRYDARYHYFYNFGDSNGNPLLGKIKGVDTITFEHTTAMNSLHALNDLTISTGGSDEPIYISPGNNDKARFEYSNIYFDTFYPFGNYDNVGGSSNKWYIVYATYIGLSSNYTTAGYFTSLTATNTYFDDMNLSNMTQEEGNDFDGTKGDWTIQEGSDDLFIKNNRTGKQYKFKLEEV